MAETMRYYYCEDGETAVGPFGRERLQELLAKDVVAWEVWVTREGEAEWRTAADFEELRDFDALIASGRLGEEYKGDLETAFTSFEEDEKRAQDLQSLQRAAARIDLSRFREAATEREEVPTGEKPSTFWFLPYLRMKYAFIVVGCLLCALLVVGFTHGGKKKSAAKEESPPPVIATTGPASLGGTAGRPVAPLSESTQNADEEEAILAETEKPLELPEVKKAPGEGKLANSRTVVKDSPTRPADFYQLARVHTVNVDSKALSMAEGTRVKVIERQPDVWTVEAEDVRFQVSPTDLRRENNEGVSTQGTTAGGSPQAAPEEMASDSTPIRPRETKRGVPPPAIPTLSE